MPRVTLSGPIAAEIIAERGEAAEDKSPAPRVTRTPRSKPPERSRSRKPLPASTAVPRADGTCEGWHTQSTVCDRAAIIVLRPNNPAFPQVVINNEGTWIRVSQPPGVTSREPSTLPAPIPGPAEHHSDPHSLPDEVWRDPSLLGPNTTLVMSRDSQIIPIVEPYPETEAETSEDDLGPLEEEPPRRSPKKRPVSSTATASRRVVYARRRIEPPQPRLAPLLKVIRTRTTIRGLIRT